MVCEQRTVANRFKREGSLPIWSQAEHECIVLCKRERRANPLNLGFRDAVGRKFVAVKDATHAGEFRARRVLDRAEAAEHLPHRAFGAEQASHAGKRQGKHHVTLCKTALDHA